MANVLMVMGKNLKFKWFFFNLVNFMLPEVFKFLFRQFEVVKITLLIQRLKILSLKKIFVYSKGVFRFRWLNRVFNLIWPISSTSGCFGNITALLLEHKFWRHCCMKAKKAIFATNLFIQFYNTPRNVFDCDLDTKVA